MDTEAFEKRWFSVVCFCCPDHSSAEMPVLHSGLFRSLYDVLRGRLCQPRSHLYSPQAIARFVRFDLYPFEF